MSDGEFDPDTGEVSGNGSHDSGPESAAKGAYPDVVQFAARTLLGDMRDRILEMFRTTQKQWSALSEGEQIDLAYRVNDVCRDVLLEGFDILNCADQVAIGATVDGCNVVTKGIQVKLVVDRRHKHRFALTDAQGEEVTLVLTGAQQFLSERAPPKVDPQEPRLPLETLQVEPREADDTQPDADADPAELTPDAAHILGRQARKHGIPRGQNHFPSDQAEHFTAWLAGWDEDPEDAKSDDEAKKRGRGRPRSAAP